MATRTAIMSPSPMAIFTVARQSIQVPAFFAPTTGTVMLARRVPRTESSIVRTALYLRSPRTEQT